MASLASNSGVALPILRFPLIISESLRSAVADAPGAHDFGTQGIVSILLSSADLAKIDLSKLQLFSVDGFGLAAAAAQPANSDHELDLPADVTSAGDEFSFQNPLVLSPSADLHSGDLTFPILKSKAVVEAEKASAEHQLLKRGAVSPSPRARRKAMSMDEMSLSEQFTGLEMVASDAAESGDGGGEMAVVRVRAKRQLPTLDLAPLPCPGLEEKAEALRRKHFERILSRTSSKVTHEEARIDLKASPAAKFLLQVMPWELTPPVTPVTTPIAIPFLWEDVPGKPKPRELASPFPSLPLPPRLLTAPPSATAAACPTADSAKSSSQPDGKNACPSEINNVPRHGRHRKNTHSWHNLFSDHHRGPVQVIEAGLEASQSSNNPVCEPKDSPAAEGGESTSSSTSVNSSNSASTDHSLSIATVSEDVASSCEPSLNVRYELPPLYVAPIVPLTPPYRDLGPVDDTRSKHTLGFNYLANLFRKGQGKSRGLSANSAYFNPFRRHGKVSSESNSYLLDDAKGYQAASGVVSDIQDGHNAHSGASPLGTKIQSVSAQLSPFRFTTYRSSRSGKHRKQRRVGSTRVFLKLRRRGSRVIVATYRAIKRALLLKRTGHSKLLNHTQLQNDTLE